MTSPNAFSAGYSQALWRRPQIFVDQHNRQYGTSIEIKTGHPTGLMSQRFDAPVMPQSQYYRFGEDPLNPSRMRIDYEAWIKDLEAAHADFETRKMQIGLQVEGDKFDPSAPLSPKLQAILGSGPYPVELVKACAAENKWALGLTPAVPSWALAFRRFWDKAPVNVPATWRNEFPDVENDGTPEPEPEPEPVLVAKDTRPRARIFGGA